MDVKVFFSVVVQNLIISKEYFKFQRLSKIYEILSQHGYKSVDQIKAITPTACKSLCIQYDQLQQKTQLFCLWAYLKQQDITDETIHSLQKYNMIYLTDLLDVELKLFGTIIKNQNDKKTIIKLIKIAKENKRKMMKNDKKKNVIDQLNNQNTENETNSVSSTYNYGFGYDF